MPIPINPLPPELAQGMGVTRASFNGLPDVKEVEQSHRDDWHLFLLQEKGTTIIEIDFQQHIIKPFTLVYIHPNQVHRLIAFKHSTFISLQIGHQHLKPAYLKLLEEITPVDDLPLKKEAFSIISETALLCIRLFKRKDEKLYKALLKDSCNTLAALMISQFLKQTKSTDKFTRAEIITKDFKQALERNFTAIKSPAEYAGQLNISTPYLNECVRNTTGHSVSHHIQQRVILEAERLLYHSDKSVKEIAAELGYEDHSYFTRLFTKIAGMPPQVFRNKNLE
jgi:AraC family transcriptional regulator, transcriptional activator of pobA